MKLVRTQHVANIIAFTNARYEVNLTEFFQFTCLKSVSLRSSVIFSSYLLEMPVDIQFNFDIGGGNIDIESFYHFTNY
jgi:hypothetical protein